MLDPKGILITWGPQHLAKGIERTLKEVDNVIVGLPVQPSLIGNAAFSIAGFAGGLVAPTQWDNFLAIWGGHHSTTMWDYAEAALAPPAPEAGLKIGNPHVAYSPRSGAYTRKPMSGAYGRPAIGREPYAGYAQYAGNPESMIGLESISPGGPAYGARWGPYQGPVSARGTRPGLKVAVGTRPFVRPVKAKVDVGPYAGGLTAPKFIPGALRPKFQLGS